MNYRFEGVDGYDLYPVKTCGRVVWVDDPGEPHVVYESGSNPTKGRRHWPVVEHPYMGTFPMEGVLRAGGWTPS